MQTSPIGVPGTQKPGPPRLKQQVPTSVQSEFSVQNRPASGGGGGWASGDGGWASGGGGWASGATWASGGSPGGASGSPGCASTAAMSSPKSSARGAVPAAQAEASPTKTNASARRCLIAGDA